MTDFKKIRMLIAQEERYRWAVQKQMSRATKSTASFSASGGCGGRQTTSRVEDGAIIIEELKGQLDEIMEELTAARDELKDTMTRIRGQQYRLEKTCLKMRYMQGISVRKIAVALNYSEDYIHRKVRAAEALIINKQKSIKEAGHEDGSCRTF